MKILVTGVAGFIGFHTAKKLLVEHEITGIDNINDYYDQSLKLSRLKELENFDTKKNFKFIQTDISEKDPLGKIFSENFDCVIHLAAQAGVRYSIENPYAYNQSNITGFLNILENTKIKKIKHLIFASSSSVYGSNIKQPFSVNDMTDFPVSVYAATKKSNEVMAHAYSHLFNIPMTGLRFFTVYGPFGRPDMAYFNFTKSIFEEKEIQVFNEGKMKRDFTYIDDIVEGIKKILDFIPNKNDNYLTNSNAPFRLLNIGNNNPVKLEEFIKILEQKCNKRAIKTYFPMQQGDVEETFADIDDLSKLTGFSPKTTLSNGLGKFVDWYKKYYEIK